jgi:hypothetical protein
MGSLTLGVVLIVRLYDGSGLSDVDRAAATAVAAQILSAASVPTSWPDCSGTRPTPSPTPRPTGPTTSRELSAFVCSRPMNSSEVAVRITRSVTPAVRFGRVPLGYSLVNRESGRGALATIYVDRVEHLAADSAPPTAALLGRAIAHEIGHLLIGDTHHSARGLMRAIWSRDMLQHATNADWLFTPREALALHTALNRTTGSAPARAAG